MSMPTPTPSRRRRSSISGNEHADDRIGDNFYSDGGDDDFEAIKTSARRASGAGLRASFARSSFSSIGDVVDNALRRASFEVLPAEDAVPRGDGDDVIADAKLVSMVAGGEEARGGAAVASSRTKAAFRFQTLAVASAAAVASASILLAFAAGGYWDGWDPMAEDCRENYATEPNCFCERPRDGAWFAQPANTASNAAFVAVGLSIALACDLRLPRRYWGVAATAGATKRNPTEMTISLETATLAPIDDNATTKSVVVSAIPGDASNDGKVPTIDVEADAQVVQRVGKKHEEHTGPTRQQHQAIKSPFTESKGYGILYSSVVCIMGPGSSALHGSLTELGRGLDQYCMYAIGTFLALYSAIRKRRRFQFRVFLTLYVAVNVPLLLLAVLSANTGLQRTVFAVLLMIAFGIEVLWHKAVLRGVPFCGCNRGEIPRDMADFRYLVLAMGFKAVGIAVWVPSKSGGPLCFPDSAFQGHAVWHVCTAFAAGCLFLYAISADEANTN